MPSPRGNSHTTLTDTAESVVKVLRKIEGIKMIAPGIIDARRSGNRHITAVYTTAGMELIISGQGVQKVAIHTTRDPKEIFKELASHKSLNHFTFHQRERKPGV